MKKVFTIFVFICVVSAFLICVQFDKESEENFCKSYIIANNENNVFNGTLSNDSNILYDVPHECPAIPFSEQIYNIDLETIDCIKPFYALYMYSDEIENDLTISYSTDNKNFVTKLLPVNLEESNYYLPMVRYKVVFDDAKFTSKHTKHDVIIKKFNSNSGVFLAQPIYEYLDVDDKCESLIIEVPVIIPVAAEMKEKTIQSTKYAYTAVNYSVSQYKITYVKMEVEGIIKTDNVGLNFCQGLGVVIPYELSRNIYESIDRSDVLLSENEVSYSPNVFYIETKNNVNVEDVGKEILNKIGQVYIQEYEYDESHYYRIKVFNEVETLFYPKL